MLSILQLILLAKNKISNNYFKKLKKEEGFELIVLVGFGVLGTYVGVALGILGTAGLC